MNKLLFVIVVYKENFWECKTYESIIKSLALYPDYLIDIIIIDNTDLPNWNNKDKAEEISLKTKNLNIFYRKFDNPGIPYAYNYAHGFANENGYEWLIFLDQDTMLPSTVLKAYQDASENKNNVDIKAPIVLTKDKILSPSYYIFFRAFLFKKKPAKILDLKYISCINTGLMIKTKLFSKANRYNEILHLDFADHDFIDRLKKIYHQLEVLDITFNQDFSSDTDTISKAKKRYKFFLKDMKTFTKNRSRLIMFISIDIPRVIVLTYKYKTFDFVKIRLGLN